MPRLIGLNAVLGFALLAFQPQPAPAQDYPSKTITLVVPLAAGTGMDIIARLYGEQLAQRLGKPVIIENKPGAGFFVATQIGAIGARRRPHAPGRCAVDAVLQPDPVQAIALRSREGPRADLALSDFALHPGRQSVAASPVGAEFIKYAKERPTPLSYSSPAGGGVPHFAVEVMKHRFGLQLTHVPYRSSPQSIMDVASGHIDFAFAEAGASLALIRDGKLRALAVSSKQRLPAHPSMPPFAEAAGARRFRSGRLAHAGRARRNAKADGRAVERRDETHHVRPRNAATHFEHGLIPLDPPSADETERYIKADVVNWQKILTSIGLAGSQ